MELHRQGEYWGTRQTGRQLQTYNQSRFPSPKHLTAFWVWTSALSHPKDEFQLDSWEYI